MSFVLENDGKLFCDWRLSIANCEESPFFYKIFIACTFHAFANFLFMHFILIFRKFVVGESWNSMVRGESGAFFLFTIPSLLFAIHFLLVTLKIHPLIPGIVWTFVYPSGFLCVLYYLKSILEALPKSLVSAPAQKPWYLNDRQCTICLIIFFCLLFLENVIFLSLAEVLGFQGKKGLARILARIGFNLFAVNSVLFALLFLWTSNSLIGKVKMVLNESKDITKAPNNQNDPLLLLSIQKMRQNSNSVLFVSAFNIIYFLILGNYPTLFTNLLFSKIVVVCATVVALIHFSLIYTYIFVVDVKRVIYRKKFGSTDGKSLQSSSRTFKRESDFVSQSSKNLVPDHAELTLVELRNGNC